jgi:hypothetical protein
MPASGFLNIIFSEVERFELGVKISSPALLVNENL